MTLVAQTLEGVLSLVRERAHQHDIGGATHGTYNPAATEIWQEGIRVTPLRLYDRGKVRADLLNMIATNVRHPRDFRGDLAAMIGSAHVGERRLLALGGEFGWATTLPAIEAVLTISALPLWPTICRRPATRLPRHTPGSDASSPACLSPYMPQDCGR